MFTAPKRTYLLLSLLFFAIEVIIATYFKDSFIRPVLGDYLVVILLYCIVRTITKWGVLKAAIGVLLLAYTIEFLQLMNILNVLGIKRNLITDILLGSSFDWKDMLAYTLGVGTVLVLEKTKRNF
ncbi:MAG: DUF2809 domain-containing protein [Saprospiraceae bacterium]|nr:DUF2809 domain-containing protein [Saprospiraceae bacterium]